MFDHVTIRVSDRDASRRFYEPLLAQLGIELAHDGDVYTEWDSFSLAQADRDHPVTASLHVGFAAPSRERVDAFWQAGTEAGYESDGEPGPRPQYTPGYYGAFLLDPDGNSAEAARHEDTEGRRTIDHLWIRVRDLETATRFYDALAPHAGITRAATLDDRVHFAGRAGSFALVAGDEPTVGLHIAFPAPSNADVDAFHAALTDAGYESNGSPGERPEYHDGYYGAFVLDPDGTNVELVNHDRGHHHHGA